MWLAVDLVTRLVIGGSLILAGLTKLISTVAWRQLWLAAHRLLPRRLVRPVALMLPSAEASVGLAMLTGVLGSGSALAGSGLLLALAIAVAIALARQREVSCHCLSMAGEVISWRGVSRSAALAVLSAVIGWHGAADLLGSTAVGWAGQLGLLAAAVLVAHGGTLAVRSSRRQQALAAIARRPAMTAPGLPG